MRPSRTHACWKNARKKKNNAYTFQNCWCLNKRILSVTLLICKDSVAIRILIRSQLDHWQKHNYTYRNCVLKAQRLVIYECDMYNYIFISNNMPCRTRIWTHISPYHEALNFWINFPHTKIAFTGNDLIEKKMMNWTETSRTRSPSFMRYQMKSWEYKWQYRVVLAGQQQEIVIYLKCIMHCIFVRKKYVTFQTDDDF